jgi:hypothetical protein
MNAASCRVMMARIAGQRMPRRIARALTHYRHGPGAFKVDLLGCAIDERRLRLEVALRLSDVTQTDP